MRPLGAFQPPCIVAQGSELHQRFFGALQAGSLAGTSAAQATAVYVTMCKERCACRHQRAGRKSPL